MALNNKTFNREVSRRFLLGIAGLLEEASTAEVLGDFEKVDELDRKAGLNIMNLVFNFNHAANVAMEEAEPKPPEDQSFWEEVVPPIYKQLLEESGQ